jgi:serine/threonine-protein kinase SRPK3
VIGLQVQKSAAHYTEAAKDEVILCHEIAEGDKAGEKHCVQLFDDFEHTGPNGRHVCMAFEVASPCQACKMLI